jgi:hypothetical protein
VPEVGVLSFSDVPKKRTLGGDVVAEIGERGEEEGAEVVAQESRNSCCVRAAIFNSLCSQIFFLLEVEKWKPMEMLTQGIMKRR